MNRVTLIVGVGGGLLVALLLAPATGTALGKLSQARAVRAEAKAAAAAQVMAPPPLVGDGLHVAAADRANAARMLIERVRTRAAQGGVLIEQAEVMPGTGGLVRMQLRLSGPDKAVIALVDALERDVPLVRFRQWQIAALGDGGLRIEGEVLAAWR